MTTVSKAETISTQRFVDALRECIGLCPLYDEHEIRRFRHRSLAAPRTLVRRRLEANGRNYERLMAGWR